MIEVFSVSPSPVASLYLLEWLNTRVACSFKTMLQIKGDPS